MACPHDLLTRARSSALSPQEQEQLALHLKQCTTCRIARQLAGDFDQVATVFAGDEQRIARIANRLVRHRPRLSRRVWVVPLIAAAFLGLGAVAAARWSAGYGRARIASRLPPDSGSEPVVSPQGGHSRDAATTLGAVANSSEREVELPSADVSSTKRDPEPRDTSRDGRPRDQGTRERSDGTSRTLFSQANKLRAAGKIPEAIISYRNLQEQFPRSAEAMLSRVSLGNLLMIRNEADSALGQFKAYLSANPRGELAEEALFGEARALGVLGRSEEEREVWDVLLSTYPGSIYAPAARSKPRSLR